MAKKYTIRSKEEKLAIVKEVLAGKAVCSWEPDIRHQRVSAWVKKYQTEGVLGLEPKKKPGNSLARYERRKELTYTEQLQYQIELLKRELAEKNAEVTRLKQRNARKEGDIPRK